MSASIEEVQISFCLLNSSGEVMASRKSTQDFYAASTIKLGVLIAVMQRVDAGSLALESMLVSKHVFTSKIPGAGEYTFVPEEIDTGMPRVGQEITIGDVLSRMVAVSSNEATNMLVELVGLDEVNAVFVALGTPSTYMTRMIGDYAAREAGFTHRTTAADLSKIMFLIHSGATASGQSTEFMLQLLRQQQYPVIADALPANCDWGAKSGWVDYIHHDVAFISTPSGTTMYLAVCTSGLWENQAQEAIRAVANQLAI